MPQSRTRKSIFKKTMDRREKSRSKQIKYIDEQNNSATPPLFGHSCTVVSSAQNLTEINETRNVNFYFPKKHSQRQNKII